MGDSPVMVEGRYPGKRDTRKVCTNHCIQDTNH